MKLSLEWAELEVMAADIRRLETQHSLALSSNNRERIKLVAAELDTLVSARAGLVARISDALSHELMGTQTRTA